MIVAHLVPAFVVAMSLSELGSMLINDGVDARDKRRREDNFSCKDPAILCILVGLLLDMMRVKESNFGRGKNQPLHVNCEWLVGVCLRDPETILEVSIGIVSGARRSEFGQCYNLLFDHWQFLAVVAGDFPETDTVYNAIRAGYRLFDGMSILLQKSLYLTWIGLRLQAGQGVKPASPIYSSPLSCGILSMSKRVESIARKQVGIVRSGVLLTSSTLTLSHHPRIR